jgi:formyl-CoA transferase
VFVDFDHPQHGRLRTVNSPFFIEGAKKAMPRAAPDVGEHTFEIMRELGFADHQIEEMIKRGAAGAK